eukprot:CCRYP_010803-RA/>CCRYP_010803-RA protein AED:0.06 eAED:0.06 QI:244/1/1/1/0.75/0.6/5/436/979
MMTSPRTLSVLYYKRSHKVHKHRGTTKHDGILTVCPPPSCLVTLTSCRDDNEEDVAEDDGDDISRSDHNDDDNDESSGNGGRGGGSSHKKRKWNARFKKSKYKASNPHPRSKSSVLYSGVHPEISRKTFGDAANGATCVDDDDDVWALNGTWECQVMAMMATTTATVNKDSNGGNSSRTGGASSHWNGGSTTTVVRRRAPLMPLRKHPWMNRRPQAKPLLASKCGIGAKKPAVASSLTATKLSSSASGQREKDANGEWNLAKEENEGHDSDDDEEESSRPTLVKRNVPPSLLRNARTRIMARPTVVSQISRGIGTAATNTTITTITSSPDEFPGASGIQLPNSLRQALRPHQREGIVFLWNCVTGANEGLRRVFERRIMDDRDNDETESGGDGGGGGEKRMGQVPRGAVLADEMGLGKTLMTIATIYSLHRHQRDRRFIIVCPSSLVSNWAKEFDQWIGKASQPKRVIVRNGAQDEGLRALKSFVPPKPQQAEVLILSYELLRLHREIVAKATRVGLLVVDEGHRLKNTAGSQTLAALNSLHAEARILISGTPIQNNLSEFYSVANFAVPGILGDLSSFRRWYERPLSEANTKNATREQKERGRMQSKALEEITKTFVLRRLQKDVLKSILPPRMELLLFCRPTEKQCELYHEISHRASKSIGSMGGREDADNPLRLLGELRKLCTHPFLLSKEGESSSLSPREEDVSLSGKLLVLERLLDSIRDHHPNDKVVIVSNFTTALSVIESCILRKKNLPFVRLDGSVELSARQPMVDSFNKGSVNLSFAFLLSSKAGGCGLNLIGANRLIMVDADWNPATDQQAMARVYRQGQTKPCYIYRMFTTGTVEEVIFQRQTQKGNLAQLANDGGHSTNGKSNQCASFTSEELRDCFTLKEGCKCDTKNKLGKKWSDYCGVSSLHTQGCTDQPLLAVCEDLVDTLSFVRVVDDEPTIDTVEPMACEDSFSASDVDFDSSSEEEEFDG